MWPILKTASDKRLSHMRVSPTYSVIFFQDFTWKITGNEEFQIFILEEKVILTPPDAETTAVIQ